jgi:hypothetical protein
LPSPETPSARIVPDTITYNLLGDLQARQALDHLQKRLDEEVVRQHEWRRKQDTSQEQAQLEPEKRESARFKSSMAFELAYNIARIDPNPSGLRLLDHDLTGVRQGAWQGLGRVGSVERIEQLRQQLKTSEPSWFQKLWGSAPPFFRYAAYRAIDHILLRLEAEGDSQDLERLKLLVPGQVDALCQPQGSLEQGICRRVQWTIAQLEVRGARRESPTAAGAPNQSHRTQ